MEVVTAVLGVFTAVGEWLTTAIADLIPMFYSAETGLTILGVLALMSLAISVVFLLVGVIQNFLHFRG